MELKMQHDVEAPRIKACTFIRNMSQDLEVSAICTCTALAVYHASAAEERRTVDNGTQTSMWDGQGKEDGIDSWQVACAACVLVSVKVNEAQRKVRDIVNVMFQRALLTVSSLEVGAAFWRMRDRLVEGEHRLLKTLGFSVKPELPFSYLLNFLKSLSASRHLACAAYALLVDSFDLPFLLDHGPHVVAAACIHVAAMALDVALPSSTNSSWYHVFSVEAEELQSVSHRLLDVVQERAPSKDNLK